MALLKLLILLTSRVYSESNQLTFQFTTVWEGNHSVPPVFHIVGIMDDAQILSYTKGTMQQLLPWMEAVDAEHWKNLAIIAKHYEHKHQQTVQRLRNPKYNSPKYVYQVRFGCDIFQDNTTFGEEEFAAHGRDFIYLDNIKQKFMSAVNDDNVATELVEEWNKRADSVQRQFFYKDQACPQWLRLYLDHSRDHLLENVRPEVTVSGRQSDGVTRLYCLVYGFHPRDVYVMWKNQTSYVPSEASPILPHPDGTYQIKVSVEVPTGEEDSYSCHVEHSSLEEDLIVKYNRRRNWRSWRMSLCSLFTVPVIMSIVLYVSRSDEVRIKKRWMILALSLYCVPSLSALLVYLKMSQEQSFH